MTFDWNKITVLPIEQFLILKYFKTCKHTVHIFKYYLTQYKNICHEQKKDLIRKQFH